MFNIKGLTDEEVKKSREMNGSNQITERKRTTLFSLIIESLNDSIIKILLIAFIVSFSNIDFFYFGV